MKRTLVAILLTLLLALTLGATAASADTLECITVDRGVVFDGCEPGTPGAPPNIVIFLPDGGIINPTP